jgi:hypothetical protein
MLNDRETQKDISRTTVTIPTRRLRMSAVDALDPLPLPQTHQRVATTEEHLLDLDSKT